MFRTIINYLEGKKREESRDISLEELRTHLIGLNGTLVDIELTRDRYGREEQRVPTGEAVKIVSQHFATPSYNHYCKLKYQRFTGKTEERHYVDIDQGLMLGDKKDIVLTRARLEYVVLRSP